MLLTNFKNEEEGEGRQGEGEKEKVMKTAEAEGIPELNIGMVVMLTTARRHSSKLSQVSGRTGTARRLSGEFPSA